MIRAAALLSTALALAGCGVPWQGGTSTAVAPVTVADAQLMPAAPEGQTRAVQMAPEGVTGQRAYAGVIGIGPNARGSVAVAPVAVADVPLTPSYVGDNITAVAPTAALGSTSKTRVDAGQTGLAPAAAPVASAAAPAPVRPQEPRPATADADSNPVGFALATTHPVGQPVYPRSAGTASATACSRYASPIAAQEAFLRAGGPQSDRLGLDPDGDGYVCGFDPTPYRRAAQG